MPKTSEVTMWVTATALNGRTRPTAESPQRMNRDGEPIVRKRGDKLTVVSVVTGTGGQKWALTASGTFYARRYLTRFHRKILGKPVSPVPGHGPGYPYGVKNSRYQAGYHTGQDYPASTGATIVAVEAGTVINVSWDAAYGNWTLIRSGGHVWLYAHQSKRHVKLGQKVKAGQKIGEVGTTGNVTGPHLHLERSRGPVWRYGDVVKPTW